MTPRPQPAAVPSLSHRRRSWCQPRIPAAHSRLPAPCSHQLKHLNDAGRPFHRTGCQPRRYPAADLDRINQVTLAHRVGRQPGPRPATRTGRGDHRALYNTASRACCLQVRPATTRRGGWAWRWPCAEQLETNPQERDTAMTQQRREAVAGLALSAGRGVRQVAAALIHPCGYVWWATDQPPDDRASPRSPALTSASEAEPEHKAIHPNWKAKDRP